MCSEREHVVDCGHPLACDLLIEKLGFFVVNGCCCEGNKNPTVVLWREFNPEKLGVSNDGESARALASIYVKHQFLRPAPPEPEQFRRRRTRRRSAKIIHSTIGCTNHDRGMR